MKLLHPIDQRVAGNVEILGGLGLMPIVSFQGSADDLFLNLLQVDSFLG